ncbi:MAG TPA: hypothetical protein DDZ80_14865 [Cyanobacteria bacterium UBA8803]|nr:hypothetical protein [Cyanobacteria bacterium UBA9273]HBL59712.1 hypothetical protein [Cyanobacteria bacterium UBA8803]
MSFLKHDKHFIWAKAFIAIILILGLFFRFVNLDQKIYWHDEFFTSLRVAGYTVTELEEQLITGQVIRIDDLQKYQQLNPHKGLKDTITSLAAEDAQNPPLYYILVRLWVGIQGLNPLQARMVSAVISLLAFPSIFGLGYLLFNSLAVSWMAVLLLAVSPFHVLYAQEARQYSLWTVTILCSSAALLRALRLNTKSSWGIYTVGVALSLYSNLISVLMLVGHGIYVVALQGWRWHKTVKAYLLASLAGLIIFSPWLLAINQIMALGWTAKDIPLLTLLKRWLLNLSTIFFDPQISYKEQLFDVRFGQDNGYFGLDRPLTFLVIPILMGVIYAIYFIVRTTPKSVWLFILLLLSSTALPLAVPDLIDGGQRSTIARYLIPAFLGIQLAVAYLLTAKIMTVSVRRKLWQLIAIALITAGILSCAISGQAETWWNKYSSYYDPQVARIVNQTPDSLIISTSAVRSTSLSYLLNSNVHFLLLKDRQLPNIPEHFTNVFLFQPSNRLREQLTQQTQYKLEPVYEQGRLWRITMGK